MELKKGIFITFFIAATLPTFSQNSRFDQLQQEMFFNILIYRPDSSVIDFVKKYYPMFCSAPQKSEWAIYPKDPPKFMNTVHSLVFKEHPFFKVKFREGRMDFSSSETTEGGRGVQDFLLWFMFDNKKDAMYAFNKLMDMFNYVSKAKRIIKMKDKLVASYTDKEKLSITNSVQFILTKDELYDNKYKIFFRMASIVYPPK